MNMMRYILYLLIVWMPTTALAEILPTFNPSCAGRATDIVVVETLAADEGTFQIVEVWHGSLKKDATVTVPDLSEIARGRMVLFLSRQGGKQQAEDWQPAGRDFKTSVVWISGDEITAIQQPTNRGAAYATKLRHMPTVGDLRERVQLVLESNRLLQSAKDAEVVEEKVALCSRIINGDYLYKDTAVLLLAKCGEPAVPVLRQYMNGQPLDHQRVRAISAFAEAGGRPVLNELSKMLEGELAYWTQTAPGLKKGWWFDTDGEAWVRHSRVSKLAVVFQQHTHPPALPTLLSLRDLFRKTPAIEDDDRIGRISELLDIAIASQENRD